MELTKDRLQDLLARKRADLETLLTHDLKLSNQAEQIKAQAEQQIAQINQQRAQAKANFNATEGGVATIEQLIADLDKPEDEKKPADVTDIAAGKKKTKKS